MTGLCCVCSGAIPGTVLSRCCPDCRAWILKRFADVERLWVRLSDHLEATSGHATGGRSGTREGSPVLIAARTLKLIGPGGVHDQLGRHLADITRSRGRRPGRGRPLPAGADHRLAAVLLGLRGHLPWACQGYDLRPLALDLRDIVASMQAAVMQAPTGHMVIRAHACTAVYPDGRSCGGQIRLDRGTRQIRCEACSTEYTEQALTAVAVERARAAT